MEVRNSLMSVLRSCAEMRLLSRAISRERMKKTANRERGREGHDMPTPYHEKAERPSCSYLTFVRLPSVRLSSPKKKRCELAAAAARAPEERTRRHGHASPLEPKWLRIWKSA